MKKQITATTIALLLMVTITFSQSVFFTGKPTYQIVAKRGGNAIGAITVELFPNIAPLHVANFDSLVNVHFFDSTAFHRVIPGFMIQGGDPNSRHGALSTWGYGDASQPTVNAEFSAAKHLRGVLSAARDADTNSANSQFFICTASAAWLNGQYSVYGRATGGIEIVDTIVNSPRDSNDNPLQKIEMFINYVGSNDSIPAPPALNLPLPNSYSPSLSRTLKWVTVSDAIIYDVEVALDSLFTTIYKTLQVGTNSYTLGGLSANTQYFWRVRTNNGGHYSNYSSVWNFFVSGVGLQTLSNQTHPVIISPNPTDGSFVIANISKGNTINIFDNNGHLVYNNIANNNTEKINLKEFAAGLYFYIILQEKSILQQGKIIIY